MIANINPRPRRNAHTETAAISSIFLPRRPVFLQNVEKKSAEMVRTTTVRIRTFEEIHDRSTEEQYERTPRCRAKMTYRAQMDIPRLTRGSRTRDFFQIYQEKSALLEAHTTIPYAERGSQRREPREPYFSPCEEPEKIGRISGGRRSRIDRERVEKNNARTPPVARTNTLSPLRSSMLRRAIHPLDTIWLPDRSVCSEAGRYRFTLYDSTVWRWIRCTSKNLF